LVDAIMKRNWHVRVALSSDAADSLTHNLRLLGAETFILELNDLESLFKGVSKVKKKKKTERKGEKKEINNLIYNL